MTLPLTFEASRADAPAEAGASTGLGWSLCVGLLVALFCLVNGTALLNDPDTQWHIAVGREIVTSGHFPTVDPFSHSFAGAPWIAKEWLAQVLLYFGYAAFGWTGVVLLAMLAIGASAAMLSVTLSRVMGPTAAGLATIIAMGLMGSTMLARPHILAMPVMLAFTLLLLKASRREAKTGLIGFGLGALALMALWVNLHASFIIGLVIAGGLGLDAVWNAPADARLRQAVRWGVLLALLTATTALTPYGLEPALMPFKVTSGIESVPFIQEWRPLPLNPSGFAALGLAALLCAALIGGGWRAAPRLLIVLFLAAMMVKHWRFVMLFAVLAPALAAPELGALLRATGTRLKLFQGGDALARSSHWRIGAPALGLLVAGLAVVSRPAPPPMVAPVTALQAAGDLAQRGRVFNSYDLGGFLILNGVPTFIDGRTDQLFLGGFMAGYQTILAKADRDGLAALLKRYQVDWALVQAGSPEAKLLSGMGWTEKFADKTARVFVAAPQP